MRTIALWISIGLAGACVAQQPGTLDSSFAVNGILTFPHSWSSEYYINVRIASDGMGRTVIGSTGDGNGLTLKRILEDGTLDTSFASSGELIVQPFANIQNVHVIGQGAIIVVGMTQIIKISDDGVVLEDHYLEALLDSVCSDPNWQIRTTVVNSANEMAMLVLNTQGDRLLRVDDNGQLDLDLAGTGVLHLSDMWNNYKRAMDMSLLANGSMALLTHQVQLCGPCSHYPGTAVYSYEGDMIYSRQHSATWYENTVAPGSIASAPNGTLMSHALSSHIMWQNLYIEDELSATALIFSFNENSFRLGPLGADELGHFLIAGSDQFDQGWMIQRRHLDGTVDTSFSNNAGSVYYPWYKFAHTIFWAGTRAYPGGMLTLANGKLLVAGYGWMDGQKCVLLARYHNIPDPRAKLDLKLFLGGPMDTNTGLMHDSLRAQGLLPLQQPYLDSTFQSVNGLGPGMTSTPVLNETGAEAAVDWVWLELLDAADTATVVATRTGLLRRNGKVTSPINHDPIDFSVGAGSYFLRVRHRNHLGVTLSDPIAMSDSVISVDLTDPTTNTFGADAQKWINGAHMLWPGDVNHDGMVRYAGAANDRDAVLMAVGGTPPTATNSGYKDADVNMDGIVKYAGVDNDRDVILQSIGGAHPTAVRFEQVP